jgi:hypothetical protein
MARTRANAYIFEGEPECCSRCVSATGSIMLELPGTKAQFRALRPHPNCDCLIMLIRAEVEIEVDTYETVGPGQTFEESTVRFGNCPQGELMPLTPRTVNIFIGQFGEDTDDFIPELWEKIGANWQPNHGTPRKLAVDIPPQAKLEVGVRIVREITVFKTQLKYVFYRAGTDERIGEKEVSRNFSYTSMHHLERAAELDSEGECDPLSKVQWI